MFCVQLFPVPFSTCLFFSCFCLLACSNLPVVPHAQISEVTRRFEYHEGDVIYFTCETGYKSDETSRYICTSVGWVAVRQEACYCELEEFGHWTFHRWGRFVDHCPLPCLSCSMFKAPWCSHAHISEESLKATEEYKRGDVIDFTCEAGYVSDSPIKHVCVAEGWVAVSQAACSKWTGFMLAAIVTD